MSSVATIRSFMPASIASKHESLMAAGGTKLITVLKSCSFFASEISSYTGTPCTTVPPLPGVTPATIFVPASIMIFACREPDFPVIPCTNTFVFLSIRIDTSFHLEGCFNAIAHRIHTVSYTHLRAHETRHDLVCRLLLEKKKK